MNLLGLLAMTIGVLPVTSYQSVTTQTDSTPNYTSINERTAVGGIAISQDMLCPLTKQKKLHPANKCVFSYSKLHYHDWLYVQGLGLYRVNDVMNPRHKRSVDIWVPSYEEERKIGKRMLKVSRLRG